VSGTTATRRTAAALILPLPDALESELNRGGRERFGKDRTMVLVTQTRRFLFIKPHPFVLLQE
jgi:hypothetical protein